jgi:hypothetical protein
MPQYEVTMREIRFVTETIEAEDEYEAENKLLNVDLNLLGWDDEDREIVAIEEVEDEEETTNA